VTLTTDAPPLPPPTPPAPVLGGGRRAGADGFFRLLALGSGLLVLVILVLITISTAKESWPAFQEMGLKFFTSSRWASGTVANTSRLIDVTMGVIISARIMPAVKKLSPLTGSPNSVLRMGMELVAEAILG